MTTTGLARQTADVGAYKLAQAADMQAAIKSLEENLGGGNLSLGDLEFIKVPAGGGQSWETVDVLTGEILPVRALEGIMLTVQGQRAYWKERYAGGSQPPDCSSVDAVNGMGSPGGDCLRCPLAAFGSAKDDKGDPAPGQACGEVRTVLFLQPGRVLPSVLRFPPTSIGPLRKYLVALTNAGLSYRAVVTSLALEAEQNTTGIKVSIIKPRMAGVVPPEFGAGVATLAAQLRPVIMQAPRMDGPAAGPWAGEPKYEATKAPAKK